MATMTTDPRTVCTGKVDISRTSKIKRQALIGRTVKVKLCSGAYTGQVESIDGDRAVVRFADGTWAYSDRRLTLV